MFVDSHCHLDYFKTEEEIEAVIANAFKNDVSYMLSIGVTLGKHSNIMKIVEKHKTIYATIGLHPCHVEDEEDVTAQQLLKIASTSDKIIGFGETGLDYFRKPYNETRQKQNFLAHIHAAQQADIPVIIHNRSADADVINILEQEYAKKSFKCIMHCFAATKDIMKRATALGFYISFSGILTFKSSDELRAIAREVPEDLLLIETDAPYLAPQKMRGKRNEPAFIRHTAEELAHIRGVTLKEIADTTSHNFFRLMNIKTDKVKNVA